MLCRVRTRALIMLVINIRQGRRIFIVINEEVEIDRAGDAHQPGLDQYQQNAVNPQPVEDTIIPPGHAKDQGIQNKCKHRKSHTECITHVSRTKPETGFQFIMLTAYGAVIVHVKDL